MMKIFQYRPVKICIEKHDYKCMVELVIYDKSSGSLVEKENITMQECIEKIENFLQELRNAVKVISKLKEE